MHLLLSLITSLQIDSSVYRTQLNNHIGFAYYSASLV